MSKCCGICHTYKFTEADIKNNIYNSNSNGKVFDPDLEDCIDYCSNL